jgi:transposase InsO family protein
MSYPILHSVHMDICGPFKQSSYGGATLYLRLMESKSKFSKICLLHNRQAQEIASELKFFIEQLEGLRTSQKVVQVLSDNALEFKLTAVNEYLKAKGIPKIHTNEYTPQSNGVVEKMNHTVLNKLRTMLDFSKLPKPLWGEIAKSVIYVHNRTVSKSSGGVLPIMALTDRVLALKRLRTVGALAKVRVQTRSKLDSRGQECIFVGYDEQTRSYHF